MFEKLAQMMQILQTNQIPFDPAVFGDPVATQVNWRPAKGGGSNIRTCKLVQVNPNRVEFKSTVGAIIFSLVFALPGIALLVFILPHVNLFVLDSGIIVALLLGLIFASLGGFMFYSQMIPIVFDKQEGFFWKGRKPQPEMPTSEANAKYVRLEQVHALQVIAEYISGKNGGFYSYELNLVLKDGNRINVADHGNKRKLAVDIEMLAEFLGVPVWDATIARVTPQGLAMPSGQ